MKYKAIIFDMDGTIVDSDKLWKEATLTFLEMKCNVPKNECHKIAHHLKGISLYSIHDYVKKHFNFTESIEEMIKMKEKLAFKNFKKHVSFINGFEEFHRHLNHKGLVSAIATNATRSSLKKTSEYLPLSSYFKNHIYCIDDVNKKGKPKPDIYLYAAKKLGIDPTECIAIEDSAHGIAAAKAANMFCIGINTGNDRDALSQADLIVDNYIEIDLKKLI